MLIAITRTTTGVTIPPVIIPNKAANSITVRATEPVVAVIRELVLSNDKPRAEVTLDVEILEVSRARVKELGLNLTQTTRLAVSFLLRSCRRPAPRQSAIQPEHDHAGRQHGRFLSDGAAGHREIPATDTNTKVLAQTQLRGAEGAAADAQYRCATSRT